MNASDFSQGQKILLQLAFAQSYDAQVYFFDEPTGNLDSKNSQEIVELLKMSNRLYHQTLIMITHDENIALQANRIISIEDGKITRDEVISG